MHRIAGLQSERLKLCADHGTGSKYQNTSVLPVFLFLPRRRRGTCTPEVSHSPTPLLSFSSGAALAPSQVGGGEGEGLLRYEVPITSVTMPYLILRKTQGF